MIWHFQVLLLLRQMEATNTQATASKVSLLMLGSQAVIDAYLCLLHLTTGTFTCILPSGTVAVASFVGDACMLGSKAPPCLLHLTTCLLKAYSTPMFQGHFM